MVDAGVSPTPPPELTVETVLHYAVEAQDAALVDALIARGADPNRGNSFGQRGGVLRAALRLHEAALEELDGLPRGV